MKRKLTFKTVFAHVLALVLTGTTLIILYEAGALKVIGIGALVVFAMLVVLAVISWCGETISDFWS